MSSYQELVSILKEILINRFYPKPEFIKGLLGDGLGNVLVPGRPDYNFARFNRSASETFEVFNKEVSQPVDGTPVLIGSLPWQPGLVQVVGIDWESYLQTGWGNTYASIQAHASTHEWPDFSPGSDYMRVFLRSIFPLQGYGDGGTGSMTFTAYPYQYDYTGTNSYWPGTPTVSLGPTRPPTGTMRYMGVYLNPATNALGVVTGSSVTFGENTEPPYPAWPLNVYPISYARVYGGQAYFTERDIKDARRLWNTTLMFTGTSAGGGGSGGWPFAHVLTVSTTDPDAQYATLAAANAAAAPGDVILLDAETYTLTATETLADAGLTIMGRGPQATIITNSVASGAALYANAANITLRNLTIRHTGAGASAGGVFVDASGLTLDNVVIEKTSGVPTVGYGLWLFDGTGHRLINGTKITCTTGTSAYGIRNTNATVTATVEGGRIEGTTQDIFGDQAGSTLSLYGVEIANRLFSFSGTIKYESSTSLGARVYNTANISTTTSTWTLMTFNSEEYDLGGFHSTVSNTGRLTAPVAGVYVITGHASFDANGTAERGIRIFLNNTTQLAVQFQPNASAGLYTEMTITTITKLAVGDYVTLEMFQNSGGSINIVAVANYSPSFAIAIVGAAT